MAKRVPKHTVLTAALAGVRSQWRWRLPVVVGLILMLMALVPSLQVAALSNLAYLALHRAVFSGDSDGPARLRELATAQKFFLQMLALDAGNFQAYAGLGRVYAGQQEYEAAVEAFGRSAHLNPGQPRTYFDLANVYEAMGESEQAIEKWREAGAVERFLWQGDRHQEAGRADLAEVEYRRAVATEPGDPRAYHALGDLHWYPGRLKEAVSWYRQALEVDSALNARVRLSQGHVAAFERRWEEAIEAYEAGLAELGKDDSYRWRLWYGLANAHHYGKHQHDQARRYYLMLHQFAPGSLSFYGLVGDTYRDGGDLGAAVDWYGRAQAAFPKSERPLVWLGAVKLAQGDLAAAESYLAEALELNPASAEARARLGVVYLQQGKAAEAEAELVQAIALATDAREYLRLLGDLYRDQGRLAEALPQYEGALALDEHDFYAREQVALLRPKLTAK